MLSLDMSKDRNTRLEVDLNHLALRFHSKHALT